MKKALANIERVMIVRFDEVYLTCVDPLPRCSWLRVNEERLREYLEGGAPKTRLGVFDVR